MSRTRTARRTTVKLTEDVIAALDAEAARTGESRSELVQRAVVQYLEPASADIGERIAEGYRRIPPGVPDAWGNLEAMTNRSTVEMLQRLDEEERRAGHEPW